jgi:glyceraldehyde-3-phosphate dehydrogenase (NADP+)
MIRKTKKEETPKKTSSIRPSKTFEPIFELSAKGVPIYKNFIDGQWCDSEKKATFDVVNPANGELLGRAQLSTAKDAEHAVRTSYDNRKAIGDMDAVDRASILENIGELVYAHRQEFVDMIVAEAGKPVSVAEGEVDATAERFKYAAEEAKSFRGESLEGDTVPWGKKKIGMVLRQPLGVVLAVSPFNYPLFIASAKIAPALAAGNAVVSKPASDDPLSLLMLTRLIELAGVPKGVMNTLTGSGAEIGDYLASHEKVKMISFTGSSAVGEHMAKVAGMKKLHMELGGKSPALVLADSDIDNAVKQCVSGALKYSGQRCDAVSRVLVEKKVADDFASKIVEEVKKWKSGDPREKDTKIGPLINKRALTKVEELVDDAKAKGAKVLLGGKKKAGLYFEATVLDKVTTDMRIAWEETFGPVVTLIRVKDMEEAISIANESDYGLDACVFTQDVDKALSAAMRLEDGTVQINSAPAHGLGNFPFGGDKDSGMDREGIKVSVEEMTKVHTIVFNPK